DDAAWAASVVAVSLEAFVRLARFGAANRCSVDPDAFEATRLREGLALGSAGATASVAACRRVGLAAWAYTARRGVLAGVAAAFGAAGSGGWALAGLPWALFESIRSRVRC